MKVSRNLQLSCIRLNYLFIYYEIVHAVHIQNNMKIHIKVVHKKTN